MLPVLRNTRDVIRSTAPSSSEFIPFLACHHSITDFEINAFLNQDSYRLLAELVDPNTHNNKLATYHSWFAIPFF